MVNCLILGLWVLTYKISLWGFIEAVIFAYLIRNCLFEFFGGVFFCLV